MKVKVNDKTEEVKHFLNLARYCAKLQTPQYFRDWFIKRGYKLIKDSLCE